MSEHSNPLEPVEGIPQMSKQELKKLLERLPEGTQVIDIREEEEYEAGHIPGIPLLPMSQLAERLHELTPDQEYVFICRSGKRSQRVSEFLKEQGFARVNNFYGGMLTWDGPVETGLPPKR